jgi:hypothetical protein
MTVQLDYAITSWELDRINPRLAEGSRTTPVYPKFSLDPSAYGYIEKGYANDIHPFSQFVDCTIQRFNLYAKKAFTANQGYLSKRLNTTFGHLFADYNGQVIDGYCIISPQYGMSGINPRHQVILPLPDIELSDNDFETKYQSAPKIINLRKKINRDFDTYRRLTSFTKNVRVENLFVGGFNYDQLMRKD